MTKDEVNAKLNALVDKRKGTHVVVYSAAKYAEDGCEFSTRLSVPEGADPDLGVNNILFTGNDYLSDLSAEEEATLDELGGAGWSVLYGWSTTRVMAAEERLQPNDETWQPGPSHQMLDLNRNILVEWSNARHKSQLVWQD